MIPLIKQADEMSSYFEDLKMAIDQNIYTKMTGMSLQTPLMWLAQALIDHAEWEGLQGYVAYVYKVNDIDHFKKVPVKLTDLNNDALLLSELREQIEGLPANLIFTVRLPFRITLSEPGNDPGRIIVSITPPQERVQISSVSKELKRVEEFFEDLAGRVGERGATDPTHMKAAWDNIANLIDRLLEDPVDYDGLYRLGTMMRNFALGEDSIRPTPEQQGNYEVFQKVRTK